MSFFIYDEPIKESDRSILNNSVVDEPDNESENENDYFYQPLVTGYPYYYGYPPYIYGYPLTPNSEPDNDSQGSSSPALKSVDETTSTPRPAAVPTPKAPAKATASRKRSHPFDKDVYKLVDFRPNNDLYEDENNYYIQLDLPGMSKEQIHMELSEDRILKISGKRQNKYKTPEKKASLKVSKMDCQYGKFSRAFNIHETANLDKIQAKMENGVLLVTIPKSEPPKTQRRTIQVQ